MKLTLRKLEVGDLASLEKLVIENIDAIEPGLQVVDSRLLLGHSAIDLVAQDAWGCLVLIALGFKADEGMLLRVVDAYSWCVEYAESLRRHFPTLTVSEDRPPRIVFVIERVPESFHRKVKQLNVAAIDLVEFRLMDVNNVAAPYFESVARIRRSPAVITASAPLVAAPQGPSSTATDANGVQRDRANGNGARPNGVTANGVHHDAMYRNGASRNGTYANGTYTNGTHANGTHANGTHANGTHSNGTHTNGTNGTYTNGTHSNGNHTNGTHTNGTHTNGADTAGTPTNGMLSNGSRVNGVHPSEPARPRRDVADILFGTVAAPATLPPAPTVAEHSVRLGAIDTTVAPASAALEASTDAPAAATEAATRGAAPAEETLPGEPAANAATAPEAVTADAVDAAADTTQKYLFSEAARASQIAKDFGIELPNDGMLTRQWVDFLNELATK
jgi:hypothetical protein